MGGGDVEAEAAAAPASVASGDDDDDDDDKSEALRLHASVQSPSATTAYDARRVHLIAHGFIP